jgi:hypothetical protein
MRKNIYIYIYIEIGIKFHGHQEKGLREGKLTPCITLNFFFLKKKKEKKKGSMKKNVS